MRPIERGSDPSGGTWGHWGDATDDLAANTGWYCAYCENHLPTGPHVEHKLPQLHHPTLALSWDNFLLACVNCNSIKGHADVALDDRVWPDRDNTFPVFEYLEGGRVNVAAGSPRVESLVRATYDMVGLGRLPNSGASLKDRRWHHRREAWEKAVRQRTSLSTNDTPELRGCIVDLATSTGFWSVWMTVFAHDQDMRQRFIDAFVGTAACFSGAAPVPRDGALV